MKVSNFSATETLSRANSQLQKGNIEESRILYQKVLKNYPKNTRAQEGLNVLYQRNPPQQIVNKLVNLYNQRQFIKVIEKTTEAIKRYPNSFMIWNLLGAAHKGLGEINKASKAFMKVTMIKPNYPEGFNNLGVTLKYLGNLDQAIEAYKRAISLKPDHYEAYYNIGIVLQEKGDFDKSIEAYNKSISLNPDFVSAYNNKGQALKNQGKLEDAIEAFSKVLYLKPDHVEAYSNIGNVFYEKGNFKGSIEAFNKALSFNSNHAETYNNIGYSLAGQDNIDGAIEAFNKALSLNPDNVVSQTNVGNALEKKGNIEDAITAYNKALIINPNYAIARAKKLYLQACICDWSSIEEERKLIPELGTLNEFVIPFSVLSFEDNPKNHQTRSEIYSKARFNQKPLLNFIKPLRKPKRIRIGYFSSDFKQHPIAYLLAGVLEKHNKDEFEIFGYSINRSKEDSLRQRLINAFNVYDDVHKMSDRDVALLARQDKIDIAIDLNGYTENARPKIFAYRAAPIQINFLGYPGTMGGDFLDYIIADRNLIPSASQKYYSEKQIYLPNAYIPTDNTRKFSDKYISKKEMGLPESGFIFCCFNNNYKIKSKEFDIWMRLLNNVEGSVLWLRKSNKLSERNLFQQAQERNINPSRLIFADRVPMDIHLSRHKLADLFLDTFTFNAHTTASEALWAGLPVVTKLGQGFAARVSGSLLKALGLKELITNNEEDYEALILELATNQNKLSNIKDKLAANLKSYPLFDTEQYTKHLEIGYKKAYQNYFDGNKPQTILVPD